MRYAVLLFLVVCRMAAPGMQDADAPKPDNPKVEPKYDDTFSGTIVELSASKLAVSRSILGRPPEKRTFEIQPDTRIEGKLRLKLKVTVGFVTTTDGDDVARLIVARPKKQPQKK
ncbi:MAG TPA: hypothetical protein VGV35_19815 [Bryobacteraceae bacterium]|nr:hypothetical protein [Bryobacteraceae bacterium]